MSQANILLVIPPGSPGTTPNREGAAGMGAVTAGEAGFRYAPQTVASVAQELRQDGHHVQALDAPALGLGLDQTMAKLATNRPDLVCAFVSWATRQADHAFMARCVGVAPTVAFGVSTRWMRDELAQATWVLAGEPERALPPLVQHVLAGELLPHWLEAESYARLRAGDQLLPAWDMLPLERYTHLSISTSRGCDADCLWCPYVVAQGERFRPRTPESVLAEMEALVTRHHPQRLIVRDPAFACDRARAQAICRLILRSKSLAFGKGITWECESRPEHFDAKLVRLLSLAGCIGIKVGLESIDPGLLATQGRIQEPGAVTAYRSRLGTLARACRVWGLALRLYAMVGLPGQTLTSAQETAHFAQELRPASLTVKRFERYPGLRGDYVVLPDEREVAAQWALLKQAQAAIAAQPRLKPARWRRLLWRYGYRLIDCLGKEG